MNSGLTKAQEIQAQVELRLFEELQRRRQETEDLVALLDEVVFRLDEAGKITFLNAVWETKVGQAVSESLGRPLTDFLGEESVGLLSAHAVGGSSQGRRLEADLVVKRVDGEPLHMMVRAKHHKDGWVGTLVDVTERRAAEIALQERELEARKLSVVAARTDNLVLITDASGRVEWVNQSFERTTGFKLKDIRGRKPGDFLQGPETDHRTIAYISRQLAAGEGFSAELCNYTADRRPYWISIDCTPVLNAQGEVAQFIAVERDVTADKLAQRALRESERRYRVVVDRVKEVIFRIDAEARFSFLNPAWRSGTGHSLDQSLGRSLLDFVAADHREALADAVARLRGGSENEIQCELQLTCADGALRWFELQLARVSELDSNVLVEGYAGTLYDIQARRETESAMRKAKEAAEQLTEERTRFVANISHEIRTPLNSIIGMGLVLADTSLDAKQQSCVDTINRGGDALLSVIDGVLDFSKLNAGQLELDRHPFDVLRPLEDAVSVIRPSLANKPVQLMVHVDPSVPVRAVSDAGRLRQVILNLLGNAAKFTVHGQITLRVEWSEAKQMLKVAVKDTGVGIDPDRLDALFEAFTQADTSTTRRYGGSGLGLNISRQLVHLAGGEIHVASQLGQGSTFAVTWPLAEVERHVWRPLQAQSLVLRMGDDLAPAIADAARWSGAKVSVSCDAGNEVLICANRELPLPDDWHRCFTPNALVQMLQGASGAVPDVRPAQVAEKIAGLRILVAEDVEANRQVMRELLSTLGCKAEMVEDGQAAVEAVESKEYDVVLMDLHMPRLDGLNACKAIRSNTEGQRQPYIIAVTANSRSEIKQQALMSGFNGWVSKPLTPDSLRDGLIEACRHLQVSTAPMQAPAQEAGCFGGRPVRSFQEECALAEQVCAEKIAKREAN